MARTRARPRRVLVHRALLYRLLFLVSPSFPFFVYFFPDPPERFTTDGSMGVHSRTLLMPTRVAPPRQSPQTAASAASRPALSQRLQSPFRTRWTMAGCTRSGRESWSCVSSCFCWFGCAGEYGGRPLTNARDSKLIL